MENFITITESIRKQILSYFEILKEDYDKKMQEYEDDINEDEEMFNMQNLEDFDEHFENEINDIEELDFEDEVFLKIIEKLNKNQYKNLAYLIILQDVWEYLKSKQISNMILLDNENSMLEFLEIWDIKTIFKKLKTSSEFHSDLLMLFIEYHSLNEIENRIINRKLIELSNNENYYDKFNVKIIDDIEYQYKKTFKIY